MNQKSASSHSAYKGLFSSASALYNLLLAVSSWGSGAPLGGPLYYTRISPG